MRAVVSFGGVLLAPSLVALLGSLTVDPKTPDAFCPTQQALEAVLSERLGELEDDYTLEYTVTRNISRHETTLHVVLLGPDGGPVLDRRVPLGPDGCSGAAHLIAHIVEAHWADPGLREAPAEAPPTSPSGIQEQAKAPEIPLDSESLRQPAIPPTPTLILGPYSPAAPLSVPTPPSLGTTYSRENEALSRLRLKDETPVGVGKAGEARSRRPEASIQEGGLKLRPSLGLGLGVTLEGGSVALLQSSIPLDKNQWTLRLSAAAPIATTVLTDSYLGLQIETFSPLAAFELAYRIARGRRTNLAVGVGFLAFLQVAWIHDDPDFGIVSEGPQARMLGAPSAGFDLSYLLVPRWELALSVFGGPTPLATADFTFTPGAGSSAGQDPVRVLLPGPLVGIAALTVSRRL
jgi:hypothetical protein